MKKYIIGLVVAGLGGGGYWYYAQDGGHTAYASGEGVLNALHEEFHEEVFHALSEMNQEEAIQTKASIKVDVDGDMLPEGAPIGGLQVALDLVSKNDSSQAVGAIDLDVKLKAAATMMGVEAGNIDVQLKGLANEDLIVFNLPAFDLSVPMMGMDIALPEETSGSWFEIDWAAVEESMNFEALKALDPSMKSPQEMLLGNNLLAYQSTVAEWKKVLPELSIMSASEDFVVKNGFYEFTIVSDVEKVKASYEVVRASIDKLSYGDLTVEDMPPVEEVPWEEFPQIAGLLRVSQKAPHAVAFEGVVRVEGEEEVLPVKFSISEDAFFFEVDQREAGDIQFMIDIDTKGGRISGADQNLTWTKKGDTYQGEFMAKSSFEEELQKIFTFELSEHEASGWKGVIHAEEDVASLVIHQVDFSIEDESFSFQASVLEAEKELLSFEFNMDSDPIDSFTLTKPEGVEPLESFLEQASELSGGMIGGGGFPIGAVMPAGATFEPEMEDAVKMGGTSMTEEELMEMMKAMEEMAPKEMEAPDAAQETMGGASMTEEEIEAMIKAMAEMDEGDREALITPSEEDMDAYFNAMQNISQDPAAFEEASKNLEESAQESNEKLEGVLRQNGISTDFLEEEEDFSIPGLE